MGATIYTATTDAEREAIFRLRYEVYVEDMHIFRETADHARRMVVEPGDGDATHMYAAAGGQIVGALRLSFGHSAPFPEAVAACYDLDRFRLAVSDAQIGICARLLIRKEHRGTPVLLQMLVALARFAVPRGIELIFCDCQPHQIGFFTNIGFRSYRKVYNDPEFGILLPLVLLTGDLAHLDRIGSPLGAFLSPTPASKAVAQQVAPLLGDVSAWSIEDVGADDAWLGIHDRLMNRDLNGPHLFEGMTESEVRQVLANSYIIDCAPGDRVIRRGQVTRTIFVVLSGALEVREDDQLVRVARQGDIVGEVAFLLTTRRIADVYAAAQGARVLILHEQTLRQLIEGPSRIAGVILLNLARILALKLAETTDIGRAD